MPAIGSKIARSVSSKSSSERKYYILTASKDHMDIAVNNSFIQQKRPNRLEKLAAGDIIVLYASKLKYCGNEPCQQIIAVCEALDDKYEKRPKEIDPGFYYRKKVRYLPFTEKPIRDLIPNLPFVKNKSRWGFYFMSGFRQIGPEDFEVIMK